MTKIIVQSENSESIKALLLAAIENELKLIMVGILKTQKILQDFESTYNMPSKKFYDLFQKGQLEDDSDYLRWAGELETLERLNKNQQELKEVELC